MRPARIGQPALSGRPLLVIDGDSFDRSYHALPKTIRRSDGKGAGAILGFANFVLRLYADERPRAVIVGWDTLEAPTKRHEMFPAVVSGQILGCPGCVSFWRMSNPFRYFNSSPEVIRLVVMMYVRYPLSLRNVEDLLAERGIDISHETVRFWWNRFGPMFAAEICKRRVAHMRGYPQWRWHLDEVFVKVNGKLCYLVACSRP